MVSVLKVPVDQFVRVLDQTPVRPQRPASLARNGVQIVGDRTPCFLGSLEQVAFSELVLSVIQELSADLAMLLRRRFLVIYLIVLSRVILRGRVVSVPQL